MDRLTSGELSRLDAAQWAGDFAVRGAQGTKGALRNRALVNNALPTVNGGSALNTGSAINFVIAQLTAKTTGIFYATTSLAWSDASGAHAAADTYNFAVFTQTGTGAVTITNSAPVTNGENVFTTNAAGGMTISAGGGGQLTYGAYIQQLGVASTATVAGSFNWSGLLQNSVSGSTAEVPFPIGNNVFFIVALNASAHPPTILDLSVSVWEMP